jgi:hypothetical protein
MQEQEGEVLGKAETLNEVGGVSRGEEIMTGVGRGLEGF